ncbi:hypothetical protein M707_22835 [Arthrobacter sp. AK-YN10]|nr:hypothetical protein M707_22835 [Arthrobacter sp. AK-YN10]
MPQDNPFRARPEWYVHNKKQAASTSARFGLMDKPDDTAEPAVVLFQRRQPFLVLSIEDAYRLSNELIDACEQAPTPEGTN